MKYKDYPKVLIVGETFTKTDGGGITLSNLFEGWPIDKIANAVDGNRIALISDNSICNNFYSIGKKEKRVWKIFSFLRRKFPSGRIEIENNNGTGNTSFLKKNSTIKLYFVSLFSRTLHLLGLYHKLYRLKLSDEFMSWIKDFNPDYIYAQFNTIEMIRFIGELKDRSNAKLVIHMMDDWPNIIVNKGLFYKYWTTLFDKMLKDLFNKAEFLLSISEGMSKEYQKKYGKIFIPFHNPINSDLWMKNKKINYSKDFFFNVLYVGRIGLGIKSSLLDVVNAIEELNNEGCRIVLQIQTSNTDNNIIRIFRKFNFIVFNPVVSHDELPAVFSKADLLLLPYDFNNSGLSFIKYSMPTKASEYMISGVPILLYCSNQTAIYEHAKQYKWAYIVSQNERAILKNAIKHLMNNENERVNLGQVAFNYAINNYDSILIRSKFVAMFR